MNNNFASSGVLSSPQDSVVMREEVSAVLWPYYLNCPPFSNVPSYNAQFRIFVDGKKMFFTSWRV